MTKQKKQLWVLVVLLVLCTLVYLGILFFTKRAEAKESSQDEIVVVEIAADTVDAFSYVTDGKTCAFTRDGESWTCDSDAERVLKTDTISDMLRKVAYVTAEERLEEYGELSDYGFDEPINTLSFTCGGKTTTILIGAYNEMLDEYYLMVDGENVVYLVDSTLKNAFSKRLDDLTEEDSEDSENSEDTQETEPENDTDQETESEIDINTDTDTESEPEE